MFRRKEEDSLFDNRTDPSQPYETQETAAAQPSHPAGTSYSNAPVPPTQQSRFTPESRPAPQATQAAPANVRASASPLPSDLGRNRLPDAKPSAPGTSPVGAQFGMDKPGKTIRRVLTVGSDILLKGEIATCDRLVIEGKVDATLNDVHTVEIAETGSFKGSAQIEEAEISGLFEGDLVVRGRLVIYSSGKVRGKITYGEIEIERGGELTGEIKTSTGVQTAASSRTAQRQPKDDKVAA